MPRKLRHPLSGAIYEIYSDGLVLVTSREGATGRFTDQGEWVEGELKQCDPHVCVWVGGPQLMSRHEEAREARLKAEAAGAATN